MAEQTITRHNHNGGKALPFGRRKPKGQCPRCDELHDGAAPRDLPYQVGHDNGYPTDAQRRDHFAPGGKHASGGCGPVCTFGDW